MIEAKENYFHCARPDQTQPVSMVVHSTAAIYPIDRVSELQ